MKKEISTIGPNSFRKYQKEMKNFSRSWTLDEAICFYNWNYARILWHGGHWKWSLESIVQERNEKNEHNWIKFFKKVLSLYKTVFQRRPYAFYNGSSAIIMKESLSFHEWKRSSIGSNSLEKFNFRQSHLLLQLKRIFLPLMLPLD